MGYVPEGLYKHKVQGSELQTLFARYNQELNRDHVTPSCQKLRKMVRQHIDQTTRTRNFKAQNERIVKMREDFQWKAKWIVFEKRRLRLTEERFMDLALHEE